MAIGQRRKFQAVTRRISQSRFADPYMPFYLTQFFLWHTLVWIPLWLGAWMCAFGTLSSFPDALRIKKPQSGNQLHEYLIPPILYNLVCWCTPLLLLGSVLPPAILAQSATGRARIQYKTWTERSMAFHLAADQNTQAHEKLYQEALAVWLTMTRAWWYYSICMTIWIVWAALVFCLYCPIGIHTLSRVNEALKAAEIKMRHQQAQTFYLYPSRALISKEHQQNRTGIAKKTGKAPSAGAGVNTPNPSTPQPIWARRITQLEHTIAGRIRWSSEEDEGRLPCDDEDCISSFAQLRLTAQLQHQITAPSRSRTTLFPPLKPNAKSIVRAGKLAPTVRRHKTLRRIYRNLLILIIGLCTAILLFLAITTLIASQQYEASRRDPLWAGRIQIIANYMAAWTNFFFGSLTIGAIFWRSFDETLTLRAEDTSVSNSASKQSQSRLSVNRAKTLVANAVQAVGLVRQHVTTIERQRELRPGLAPQTLPQLNSFRGEEVSDAGDCSPADGTGTQRSVMPALKSRMDAAQCSLPYVQPSFGLSCLKRSLSNLVGSRDQGATESGVNMTRDDFQVSALGETSTIGGDAYVRSMRHWTRLSPGHSALAASGPSTEIRGSAALALAVSADESTGHDTSTSASDNGSEVIGVWKAHGNVFGLQSLSPLPTRPKSAQTAGTCHVVPSPSLCALSRSHNSPHHSSVHSAKTATTSPVGQELKSTLEAFVPLGRATILGALNDLNSTAAEPSRYGGWRRAMSLSQQHDATAAFQEFLKDIEDGKDRTGQRHNPAAARAGWRKIQGTDQQPRSGTVKSFASGSVKSSD